MIAGALTCSRDGDFAAIDKIHTYRTWATIDFWATVGSAMVVGSFQRRWMDAGYANALTRPDIGLRWFRELPSSKTFMRWQWTQAFGYLGIVFLNIVFRHAIADPERLRAWAVLQVSLCATVIVASVGGSVSARRMTAQLLERVDLSQEAARAARVTEPDPIA